MTTVVNIRAGEFDVYIGRSRNKDIGIFGNPFTVEEYGREGAIERYRHYFALKLLRNPEFRERVEKLRGKRLGCFCKPLPCHGDIIAEYLDAPSTACEP